MKKLLLLLITAFSVALCGLGLTACGETEHTHTFESTWSKDATHHWYACSDDTCTETNEKAEHTFTDYVCSVCGQEKALSKNEVKKEQFDKALSFNGVSNVSMEYHDDCRDQTQEYKADVLFCFDGNKIKAVGKQNIILYADVYETYVYVYEPADEHNQNYERSKMDDITVPTNILERAEILGSFDFVSMLSGMSYSDFSYSDGYYTGTHPKAQGATIKLKFENGKLISYKAELIETDASQVITMDFYDYGTTAVTLPTDYTDAPGPSGPDGPNLSTWVGYFDFDNVTSTYTSETTYYNPAMTFTMTEKIKIADNKWLWESSNYYYNEITYAKFNVYYDGVNAYANGTIDNEENGKGESFFIEASIFAYVEEDLTETSDGVFEAEEIVFYTSTYTDVRIVIENEKIVSLSFVRESTDLRQVVSYTFTDWEETTVDGNGYTTPSAWASYFEFDNYTATETYYAIVGGSREDMALETKWKVNGNAWNCKKDMQASDFGVFDTKYMYYDGTNAYLDGEATELSNIDTYNINTYIFDLIIGIEGACDKVEEGNTIVYTTDSFFYDIYTDLEIVVENGKIKKITYTNPNGYQDVNEQRHPMVSTIVFSDYGNTTVTDPYPND